MKSTLGGVASIRVELLLAGFSHVSVGSMKSRRNLEIRSLIKNDLLERDLTFRSLSNTETLSIGKQATSCWGK